MRIVNAVGQQFDFPLSVWMRREPLPISIPALAVGGRSVITGKPTPSARTLEIEGAFIGLNRANLRSQYDALQTVLSKPPLKFYAREQLTRYLTCYVEQIEAEWRGSDELGVRLSLLIPDPLWAADTENSYTSAALGNDATFNLINAGTAPSRPLIRLTGTGSTQNPTLSNLSTGEQIALVGSLANGETLEVDCARMTAKRLPSTNALHQLSSASLFGLRLDPGTNNMRVNVTGSVGVEVRWRDRWY